MAPEHKAGDLGTKLREARERRGLSLRQIANDTKISMSVLEALERNDISRLPGGIFSRSFVRTYAVQVGLDPEVTVEDFLKQFSNDTITVGHAQSHRNDETESFESDQRVASLVLRLVVVSVPIAALVVYFGFRPWGGPTPEVSAPATAAVASPAGSRATGSGASDRFSLEIVAVRACTVSVALEGQAAVDTLLDAGARRTFDVQHDVLLTTSDAGAIEWSVNGRPGRPAGVPGGPATLHLTLDNYEAFLVQR